MVVASLWWQFIFSYISLTELIKYPHFLHCHSLYFPVDLLYLIFYMVPSISFIFIGLIYWRLMYESSQHRVKIALGFFCFSISRVSALDFKFFWNFIPFLLYRYLCFQKLGRKWKETKLEEVIFRTGCWAKMWICKFFWSVFCHNYIMQKRSIKYGSK